MSAAAHRLKREAFRTSRLAEFCSRRELIAQTGHDEADWPVVMIKEPVDNSLDHCEEVGIAPEINVSVKPGEIRIIDNGRGIPADVVSGVLDYTLRVSSREAYVSPSRGAQGNALKTLLPMGFALSGERGETIIESQGAAHRIVFSVDNLRQEPRIAHEISTSPVKSGTAVRFKWPESAKLNPPIREAANLTNPDRLLLAESSSIDHVQLGG